MVSSRADWPTRSNKIILYHSIWAGQWIMVSYQMDWPVSPHAPFYMDQPTKYYIAILYGLASGSWPHIRWTGQSHLIHHSTWTGQPNTILLFYMDWPVSSHAPFYMNWPTKYYIAILYGLAGLISCTI